MENSIPSASGHSDATATPKPVAFAPMGVHVGHRILPVDRNNKAHLVALIGLCVTVTAGPELLRANATLVTLTRKILAALRPGSLVFVAGAIGPIGVLFLPRRLQRVASALQHGAAERAWEAFRSDEGREALTAYVRAIECMLEGVRIAMPESIELAEVKSAVMGGWALAIERMLEKEGSLPREVVRERAAWVTETLASAGWVLPQG